MPAGISMCVCVCVGLLMTLRLSTQTRARAHTHTHTHTHTHNAAGEASPAAPARISDHPRRKHLCKGMAKGRARGAWHLTSPYRKGGCSRGGGNCQSARRFPQPATHAASSGSSSSSLAAADSCSRLLQKGGRRSRAGAPVQVWLYPLRCVMMATGNVVSATGSIP